MSSQRRVYSGLLSALPCIAGAVLAVGIKYYYSRSSSDGLLWILYPTSFLVEQLSSLHFVHVARFGLVDHTRGIAIVQACAGLNFLVILFCTLFFSFLRYRTSTASKWSWLLTVLVCSCVLTIAVNSIRIVFAVFLYEHDLRFGLLTAARMHRIGGLVVYFLSLTLVYVLVRRMVEPAAGPALDGVAQVGPGRVIRFSVPLLWYALVAVVVPVLNGGLVHNSPSLPEHSGTVIALCTFMSLAAAFLELYFDRFHFKIGVKRSGERREGEQCPSQRRSL